MNRRWKYAVKESLFKSPAARSQAGQSFMWRILATDPDGNQFECPNVYTEEVEARETAALLGGEPPFDIADWRVAALAAERMIAASNVSIAVH